MSATARSLPPSRFELPALCEAGDATACCAAAYEHPAVRWLLGGDLHPGGEATTRRALELIGVGPRDRLLDVASGTGASAMLAAREYRCTAAGVEYGAEAVTEAQSAAEAAGLCERVGFVAGDAEHLPFPDDRFDAVLCECSLSVFADKARAVQEMRRVLRPDGRVAIADVTVESERLPDALRGPLATFACVGEALDAAGYTRLLDGAGFVPRQVERHDQAAARLAARVEERLRGARLLGAPGAGDLVEIAVLAREAIEEGVLGYIILTAG